MTPLSAPLETARKDGIQGHLGVLAATKIYKGSAVYSRQSGVGQGFAFTIDGTNTLLAGDRFEGIAHETVDNSAGSNGTLSVHIDKAGSFLLPFSDTFTGIETGAQVYQDNTSSNADVTITANAAAVQAVLGEVAEIVTTGAGTSTAYVRVKDSSGVSVAAAGVATNKNYKVSYDFSVQGGAIGSISLPVSIPSGVVILDGLLNVITPLTGSGATAAIQIEGANDVISAAAISGAPWSSSGLKDVVPAGTAATAIKTTTTRVVTLVVGTHALTAGKFDLYLRAA